MHQLTIKVKFKISINKINLQIQYKSNKKFERFLERNQWNEPELYLANISG